MLHDLQFELLEPSRRPQQTLRRRGVVVPTYVDHGNEETIEVRFAIAHDAETPFLLHWRPPERPPVDEPQALTVIMGRLDPSIRGPEADTR